MTSPRNRPPGEQRDRGIGLEKETSWRIVPTQYRTTRALQQKTRTGEPERVGNEDRLTAATQQKERAQAEERDAGGLRDDNIRAEGHGSTHIGLGELARPDAKLVYRAVVTWIAPRRGANRLVSGDDVGDCIGRNAREDGATIEP